MCERERGKKTCVGECVCLYVCVCVREREREREGADLRVANAVHARHDVEVRLEEQSVHSPWSRVRGVGCRV